MKKYEEHNALLAREIQQCKGALSSCKEAAATNFTAKYIPHSLHSNSIRKLQKACEVYWRMLVLASKRLQDMRAQKALLKKGLDASTALLATVQERLRAFESESSFLKSTPTQRNLPPKLTSTIKFRKVVIAVLAANRLLRMPKNEFDAIPILNSQQAISIVPGKSCSLEEAVEVPKTWSSPEESKLIVEIFSSFRPTKHENRLSDFKQSVSLLEFLKRGLVKLKEKHYRVGERNLLGLSKEEMVKECVQNLCRQAKDSFIVKRQLEKSKEREVELEMQLSEIKNQNNSCFHESISLKLKESEIVNLRGNIVCLFGVQ